MWKPTGGESGPGPAGGGLDTNGEFQQTGGEHEEARTTIFHGTGG